MNVNGFKNVHPQTAAYRALIFVFKDANRTTALSLPTGRQAMPRKTVNTIFNLRHACTDL